MTDTIKVKLGFFKLVVKDLDLVQNFLNQSFGFVEKDRITTKAFVEVMMALPKQDFLLVLYQHQDGRDIKIGTGHGPVGLVTDNVEGLYEKAISNGGVKVQEPMSFGPARLAFVSTPEGHVVELFNPKPS